MCNYSALLYDMSMCVFQMRRFTVNCTVYSVQGILYSVQYTVYCLLGCLIFVQGQRTEGEQRLYGEKLGGKGCELYIYRCLLRYRTMRLVKCPLYSVAQSIVYSFCSPKGLLVCLTFVQGQSTQGEHRL